MAEKKPSTNKSGLDFKKPKTLFLPLAVLLEIGAVVLAVRAAAVLAASNSCDKLLPGQLLSWLLALAGLILAVGGGIIFYKQDDRALKLLAGAIVVICLVMAITAWAISVLCM